MIEFLHAYMAPIMFLGLIVFLLMGFSVAFSLAACGLFFGYLGVEIGLLPATLMQALPLVPRVAFEGLRRRGIGPRRGSRRGGGRPRRLPLRRTHRQ